MIISGVVLAWHVIPGAQVTPSRLARLLTEARHSPWAIPAVIGIYLAATTILFPLTLLVLATAAVFPPFEALPLAFAGILSSACCGYVIGRMAGDWPLHFFTGGPAARKIKRYTSAGGVLAVTFIRLLPIFPLAPVDFSLGVSKTPFFSYIAGTILGLFPGVLAFTFLGHFLIRLWRERSIENLILVGTSFIGWFTLVALAHHLVKRWRRKR